MTEEPFRILPGPVRTIGGYTLLIVLLLIIFPVKGKVYAIKAANVMVPLLLYTMANPLMDIIDRFFGSLFKRRTSDEIEEVS